MADGPPRYAGDPVHPDHERFLLELGKATWAAYRLTTVVFDILRVIGDFEASDLYRDPLGALQRKLSGLTGRTPAVPELLGYIAVLDKARITRNDLIHALPNANGLQRRLDFPNRPSYFRNFYTVESLTEIVKEFDDASRVGAEILYRDDGAFVRAWYER